MKCDVCAVRSAHYVFRPPSQQQQIKYSFAKLSSNNKERSFLTNRRRRRRRCNYTLAPNCAQQQTTEMEGHFRERTSKNGPVVRRWWLFRSLRETNTGHGLHPAEHDTVITEQIGAVDNVWRRGIVCSYSLLPSHLKYLQQQLIKRTKEAENDPKKAFAAKEPLWASGYIIVIVECFFRVHSLPPAIHLERCSGRCLRLGSSGQGRRRICSMDCCLSSKQTDRQMEAVNDIERMWCSKGRGVIAVGLVIKDRGGCGTD